MEGPMGRPRFGWFFGFFLLRVVLFAGLVAGTVALWKSLGPEWPSWERAGIMVLAVGGGLAVLRALRFMAWRRYAMRHNFATGLGYGHGCGCGHWGVESGRPTDLTSA